MKNNPPEAYKGDAFQNNKGYSDYEFELGDYNNDGEVDLYAIKKQSADAKFTEIHVLSGASNFTSSLLKIETVLKDVGANCKFELGDYNNDGEVDLYVIKKQSADTNFTEIHVLSGASNYKTSLLKIGTVLNEDYSNYEFQLGDYNDDGKVDLYALKTSNTDTDFPEIYVLNGASNYTSFLLKTESDLDQDNANDGFHLIDNNEDEVDLYKRKKQNRGSRLTGV